MQWMTELQHLEAVLMQQQETEAIVIERMQAEKLRARLAKMGAALDEIRDWIGRTAPGMERLVGVCFDACEEKIAGGPAAQSAKETPTAATVGGN